ncbi:MAG: glycosyltransferase [Eubacterium sp.]|nr:glycosyltransferase [Eubacterium sp.]
MGKNRVSVLVTFYNQEMYVERALKSILKQKTDFGVRILVGDDASSDGTRKIIQRLMEENPNQIELFVMDKTNNNDVPGFRASRNRLNLLKHVETEYFIFLDGDDYFTYDRKLEEQVKILDDANNKDCIACGHNIEYLNSDGWKKTMVPPKYVEAKYNGKKYWSKMYFHTNTLLIRSKVIKSIPQKLVENNFNDNLITFLLIQKGKLYYVPKAWAVYYQTGNGIWTSNNRIVNCIRDLIVYDLCNKINPSMKRASSRRFTGSWKTLFKKRKEIKADDLELLSVEAYEKDLCNAYKWIHYSELGIIEKLNLCIKVICICWKSSVKNMAFKVLFRK